MHRPQPGCKCGRLRPFRKLHAFTGCWLAIFVAVHMAISVTGVHPAQYQAAVGTIHQWLGAYSAAVLAVILAVFAVQAVSGVYLAAKEGLQYNVKRCDRGGKLRFFLQRASGLLILLFLAAHLGLMRGWGAAGERAPAATMAQAAFSSTISAFHPWRLSAANLLLLALLLLSIWGVAYHAANGALSGAILWKVVRSAGPRAAWSYVCVAIGVVLAVLGTAAWYAFSLSPQVQTALAAGF
jgi:succinate dehydrogenase / fumarate reductase cytochrome b subunit